jgi:hypothetical protein
MVQILHIHFIKSIVVAEDDAQLSGCFTFVNNGICNPLFRKAYTFVTIAGIFGEKTDLWLIHSYLDLGLMTHIKQANLSNGCLNGFSVQNRGEDRIT